MVKLEDSKAAPQKLNHQPFVKNQNYQITTKCGDFRCTPQPPQSPHIVVIYMRKMDTFGFPSP